ncbi:hypothetical protein [Pseudobacteriovorax antillogorgiicola]|uniref:Uncharacterized protein n=1 Tax=Pseudobacteriovorax antillogorgiicola TaxID=1513793 RepID=A0A1Y6CHC2_9BACT|nr:hypothetical protein [Pseudobacteriovorax antillogorgiicola]TCS47310.1 hypothetical protein EDD56_12185 [Pseudobacteriovorax antillogorgiicola]SMF62638.1 hypothetical protein SAMN06296036_12185 [Pseudobacteriovorax antillogorgiicola]
MKTIRTIAMSLLIASSGFGNGSDTVMSARMISLILGENPPKNDNRDSEPRLDEETLLQIAESFEENRTVLSVPLADYYVLMNHGSKFIDQISNALNRNVDAIWFDRNSMLIFIEVGTCTLALQPIDP